jgi:serralysin
MATPTTNSLTAYYAVMSGNNEIDSLVYSKWGGGGFVGNSLVITYSFPGLDSYWSTTSYGPTDGYREPWSPDFDVLSGYEQSAFISAMSTWASVANITFVEVADNYSTVGDLRVAWTTYDIDGAQAHAYLPWSDPSAGDIWLNGSADWTDAFDFGSYGYLTLIRELGHALGLKNTFEAYESNVAVLPEGIDAYQFSVMSDSAAIGYSGSVVNFNPTTPMSLDIAAMQYLYGANMSHHAGNDVYTFSQGQSYFKTIWDAGGIDTFVWNATTQSGDIDLRAGHWSALGNELNYTGSDGGFLWSTNDTVQIYSTVTIENAIGGNANDTITGNSSNNSLQGGAGNDVMYGDAGNDTFDWDSTKRSGNDTMYGGLGNDTYVLNSSGDRVIELSNQGTDLIWSEFTYSLTSASNVENLSLLGTGNLNASGNTLSNVLTGNSGNNSLQGGAGNDVMYGGAGNDTFDWDSTTRSGNDTMYGGLGNDTYVLNSSGDRVIELSSQGTDLIWSEFTYSLTSASNVENLSILGTSNINASGNTLSNVLTGNSGKNSLSGGLGKDTLYGGAGADRFVFDTALSTSNTDTIKDFQRGIDKLVLDDDIFKVFTSKTTVSTGNFIVGTKALQSDDYLIYNTQNDMLYYDADGSGSKYGMVEVAKIELSGSSAPTYTDFVVVA